MALLSLLLVLLVLRQAMVRTYAATRPATAARAWAGHPAVVLESELAEVGETAAAGRPVPRALIDRLLATYAKAPLAPEPFLVRGIQMRLAGQEAVAGRAFVIAKQRNPRSIAARYFLADHYLRSGATESGLTEIATLARLVPQSLPGIAPYLAAYARMPGARREVLAMIRRQPQLEAVLLDALAADPANQQLILSLWSGRGGDEAQGWQRKLVLNLVAANRFDEARAAWARFSGLTVARDQLFDPAFEAEALPPFGWSFAAGSSGVAEPQGQGRLSIIYYGRDNLVLATQLLTLPPGRYRLTMRVPGTPPGAASLAWTVSCLPAATMLADASLAAARGGAMAISFAVPPANCPAQKLELVGRAPDIPRQVEASISGLRLERESGG